MSDIVRESLFRLKEFCEKENFKGYDPYDGLNSSLFHAVPFLSKSRHARLAWIQLFKRSSFNLRPILVIHKEFNPKALGLFLSGYCNLFKISHDQQYLDKIRFLINAIKKNISKNWSGACWGYNFDWQSLAFFLPKYTPTVVATSFISSSLLDAYQITGEEELLQMARSSCDFILNDLNRTDDDKGNYAYSYSPLDRSVVFNASLLGSRLMARIYSLTNETKLIEASEKSVAFCCDKQNPDGSWNYGLADFHRWIDNFHTGYNLECISDYIKNSGDTKYDCNVKEGFGYYINTFFTEEGISKYYSDSLYPIDIHAPAQLIITLSRLGKLQEYKSMADKVLGWTIENMQDRKGYFYFQKKRMLTSRIPYMRWAQAWMFYALSEYLKKSTSKL